MKTSIKISLFAVIIAMTAMSFTLLPVWPTYNSVNGYSIKFPGAPAVTPKTPSATILAGEVAIHRVAGMPTFTVDYEQKTGGAYVMIPNVINDKVNQFASKRSGTVAWGAAVAAWKGCQSREATVTNATGLRVNIRVAILADECWILIAENNGAFTPAADWNQFLNSFQH